VPSTGRRILADVNLWLATLVEQHPHHAVAVDWWRSTVLPSHGTVYFCRVTQLGLLRLLTNEIVMGRSRRSPEQAWRDHDQLLEQGAVDYLDEPAELSKHLRRYASGQVPSASLWTDAYLAAFARAEHIDLATFDRGFKRFPELPLRLLG